MSEQTETPMMEVLQPSALHALERAQIDTQVATAHQYPRSLESFKKRALGMATLDEDTADSCIYVRPVGKKLVNGKWTEEYAEGASIRMAEIVAASYGNLRVAARIIEQTERFVKCEGVCHDLESNYAAKSEVMETTVKKDGTPYSEGMRAVVAKATLSKAFRDSVFKVVPRALCKTIYDAAKKVAAGQGKPLEERRKKAMSWVQSRKIEEARVFAALGVNGWSEVTDDHLLKLTGLKTAITDGEVQIDEAFPPVAKAPEHTGPGQPPQPPKEPLKPPQQPSKAPEGAKTPPKEEKSQVQSPVSSTPSSGKPAEAPQTPEKATPTPDAGSATSTYESSEEEAMALTEAGLAPEQPKAQEQAPAAPAEPDPYLANRKGESDACASVKLLAIKSGVSGAQLRSWLVAKKLSKPEQGLHELSQTKLEALNRTWAAKLPEIRAQKV